MALVDQHMVPSEETEDRMLDLLMCDDLFPVRHLEQPKDARVALLLSSKYLSFDASCPFAALEETLDPSLLADPSKWLPNVCTLTDMGDLAPELLVLRSSLICLPPSLLWTLRLESPLPSSGSWADLTGMGDRCDRWHWVPPG
jgi:hypothetical protein